MATAAVRVRPFGRRRLGVRSARLRLTLLYSGMFLALGTVLIAIIFIAGASGAPINVQSSAASAASPTPAGAPAIHAAVSQQHSEDLGRLLAAAWVTLALTAAASAVLGWFLAGRVLRPLREMTAAARTISAGKLDRRLALTGPEDEFKQLGDTIDDLLARLQASFASQRRFIANAAHELRTPLTLERALLQVALADPDGDEEALRATCQELLAAGRDHERLLDALLTLAASERGLDHLQPTDLAAVTDVALTACAPAIAAATLEVSSQLAPAPISGDRALIERLVANLIDNAVSYNRPGGRIDIRTGAMSERASLTVTNTGQPVSARDVERLFEPFRRLQPDRSGDGDGHHGLGLSIVAAIATAHNATVSAVPGPEGGLAITVAFSRPRG